MAERVGLVEMDEHQVDTRVGDGLECRAADGGIGRAAVRVQLGPGRHDGPRRPGSLEIVEAKHPRKMMVAHDDGGPEPGLLRRVDDGWEEDPIRPYPARNGARPGRQSCAPLFLPGRRRSAGMRSPGTSWMEVRFGRLPGRTALLAQPPEVGRDGRPEVSKRESIEGNRTNRGVSAMLGLSGTVLNPPRGWPTAVNWPFARVNAVPAPLPKRRR